MTRKKNVGGNKSETLLEQRMREWGIPECTYQPSDNNVVVWRLPPLKESPGGIIIPEEERSPSVKGILMAMGPRAMDVLISNGYQLGHVVIFARFAGFEHHDNTPEFARHNMVLVLKDRDIVGSDDLKREIDSGRAKYVLGPDGRHRLERKLLGGRKEKLLALAASTHSPAERETAMRIANGR